MRNNDFQKYMFVIAVLMLVSFIVIRAPFIFSASHGPNYENVTVDTRVNITESKSTILGVVIDQGNLTITLNAGLTRLITCNITIRDYNGWNDTTNVNATFWDNTTVGAGDPDDDNNHYSNSSCTRMSNDGQYVSNWDCSFNVWYHANNGSNWVCNATAKDTYTNSTNNYTDSGYNVTTINSLYALNVTSLIDYGDMAAGDTSTASEIANITNFGNMDINISLYGWGGNNLSDTTYSGLSFVCEIGNISVENERYSLTDQSWLSMTNLTNESTLIQGLTMPQRTASEVVNTTFWRLYVPPAPFGQCNGTIVFAAEIP
ncbi:hypothetical protein ACFLTH_09940 [Bacteroidota bacterium]